MDDRLKLPDNNLYQKGIVVTFADGSQLLQREELVYGATMKDTYHTVVEGNTLDGLAEKFYSNFVNDPSKYWFLIADVNNIQNPLDIDYLLGITILIPNIFNAKLQL